MSESVKARGPAVTDRDFGPQAGRPGDDGQPEAEKKGRGKKEKKTSARSGPVKAEIGKKEKKRVHPFVVFLATFLFCLLLAAAALAALYFDFYGVKAPFNELFNQTPLAVEARESIFRDREEAIDRRQAELEGLDGDLAQRQLDLEARERSLTEDREALEETRLQALAEDAARDAEMLELAALIGTKQALDEAVATYNRLTAAQNATLLVALYPQNPALALAIYLNLKPALQAETLAALSTEDAVLFTLETVTDTSVVEALKASPLWDEILTELAAVGVTVPAE